MTLVDAGDHLAHTLLVAHVKIVMRVRCIRDIDVAAAAAFDDVTLAQIVLGEMTTDTLA